MMNYFEHKSIWITGASSGIGEGFVNELSNVNCHLIISARREPELQRVKDANKSGVASIDIVPVDLSNDEQVIRAAGEVLQKFDSIDIIVHCGGISQRASILDTTIDVQRQIMDVNYFGTVHLSALLLPKMIEKKAGHHVVISSVMGMLSIPNRSSYAASKHALHGFYDSLRAEHADDNVKVTLFCPGYINTNLSLNALKGDGSQQNARDEALVQGLSVEQFVQKALKDIANQKEEAYIGGFKEVLGIYVKRFLPSLFSKIAKKQV